MNSTRQSVRTGHALVYGDNVNTDVIFPGKYTYTVGDRSEMARHAFEDLDPTFRQRVKPGDFVVAGRNFGCGSSREQAVICLVELGIAAVIAESFSRIYFRNAINQGLPAIVLEGAPQRILEGDHVRLNLDQNLLEVPSGTYRFPPLSPDVQAILDTGGLVNYTKLKLGRAK